MMNYTLIYDELINNGSIIFSYRNEFTSFNVFLSIKFKILNKLDWGGNPGGLFVSLVRLGSFWFYLDKEVNPNYVAEKLNLSESDALTISVLINSLIQVHQNKIKE